MNAVLKLSAHFTYADYCNWSEEERWELINGEAYAMSAPSRLHQKIVSELSRQIGNYLQGKSCEIYVAPFDVRLPTRNEKDEQIDTVVQPDISVICNEEKLDEKGCRGAPDWIIEILSPSSAFRDMELKRKLYERHGVREYWIIHPTERWLMIYFLDLQGKYGNYQMFPLEKTSQVAIFPDLQIDWEFLSTFPIKSL
ncbi:MAG: hypothetical protein RIT27_1376 [Pseudomonadota bacterium]|jgi:Uma2 family endonuclease